VTEVHAVLKQLSAIVREAVGLTFEEPNPSPQIVTVEPALFARFELSRLLTLTTGAATRSKTAASTKPSERIRASIQSKLNIMRVPATALTLTAVRTTEPP
jgi:hypothetical protein